MRKCMILLATVLTVFVIGGCSSPQEKAPVLLFEYHDFGPQVIAHELIGFEWYQWHDHGFEEPDYCYNIRIVVYHEGDLERVKAQYPIVEGRVDYRYVEHEVAIEFLKSRMSQCGDGEQYGRIWMCHSLS